MMQDPNKPEANKPEPLKGLDLEKFANATQELLKNLNKPDPLEEKAKSAIKKGASFFKKAKAALKGDEKAKEELADAAAKTLVKTGDALEQAGKAAGDMIDKVDRKITEARDKKPPAP